MFQMRVVEYDWLFLCEEPDSGPAQHALVGFSCHLGIGDVTLG